MPARRGQLDCGRALCTHSRPHWLKPGARDTNSSKLLLHLQKDLGWNKEKHKLRACGRGPEAHSEICTPMKQLSQLRLKSVGSGGRGCGYLSASYPDRRLSHDTPSLILSSKMVNNTEISLSLLSTIMLGMTSP